MADNISISVVNLTERINDVSRFGRYLNPTSEKFLLALTKHMVSRVRANEPIDTGTLRAATQASPVSYVAGGYRASIEVPDYVYYAIDMHESLEPYMTEPVPWGLSLIQANAYARRDSNTNSSGNPGSLDQPPTPEGDVGGKYITRVFAFHFQMYNNGLRDAIQDIFKSPTPPKINFGT